MSGLVMLLPHGYEGQGPEHSSARPRALPAALCRGQHASYANLTTPAQYFHMRCAGRSTGTSASR